MKTQIVKFTLLTGVTLLVALNNYAQKRYKLKREKVHFEKYEEVRKEKKVDAVVSIQLIEPNIQTNKTFEPSESNEASAFADLEFLNRKPEIKLEKSINLSVENYLNNKMQKTKKTKIGYEKKFETKITKWKIESKYEPKSTAVESKKRMSQVLIYGIVLAASGVLFTVLAIVLGPIFTVFTFLTIIFWVFAGLFYAGGATLIILALLKKI